VDEEESIGQEDCKGAGAVWEGLQAGLRARSLSRKEGAWTGGIEELKKEGGVKREADRFAGARGRGIRRRGANMIF
jgi:hypothetical protein